MTTQIVLVMVFAALAVSAVVMTDVARRRAQKEHDAVLAVAALRHERTEATLAAITADRDDMKRINRELDFLVHQACGLVIDMPAVGGHAKLIKPGTGRIMELATWCKGSEGQAYFGATGTEPPVYTVETTVEEA